VQGLRPRNAPPLLDHRVHSSPAKCLATSVCTPPALSDHYRSQFTKKLETDY